jgi:regulator of replication initiation timing
MKRRKRSCSNCKRLEKDVKILKEMVATFVVENKKLAAENRFLRDKVKELEE